MGYLPARWVGLKGGNSEWHLTKAEAAKLTNDMFLRGVIETIIYESPILMMLPFMEVTGTAITYNRESTMPAAAFYAPLDTWTEAAPTFTQKTAALKILGGDADVDNFLQQTYADPNDLEAVVIESRAKAVAHKFSDTFFNGDTGIVTLTASMAWSTRSSRVRRSPLVLTVLRSRWTWSMS